MRIVSAAHLGVRGRATAADVRPGAFTMIELLIVIVVIVILIAAIGLVGSRVMRSQKVHLTETTMAAVKAAIDQFAEENPLRSIYDRRGQTTFGPYPPYQLSADLTPQGLGWYVEPDGQRTTPDYYLSNRLWRDLGNSMGNLDAWVLIPDSDRNDDIRALYAYLRVYAPDVLAQVPGNALKPLGPMAEYVNPAGTGPAPGVSGNSWVDVLGIHDGWGVPLDYFLYVKVEFGILPGGNKGWRVTDRIPVLRSRGIDFELYDQWCKDGGAPPDTEGTRIYSDPFPAPPACQSNGAFWANGTLSGNTTRENGWARAIGVHDLYKDGDRADPHMFGYVP